MISIAVAKQKCNELSSLDSKMAIWEDCLTHKENQKTELWKTC